MVLGEWTITIQNAWGEQPCIYDLEVVFDGICEGDCFDPDACNFNPNSTLVYNDLFDYAIDLYPSGLYDCEGNCLLDFDDDGICNAAEVPGCQVEWACNYNPAATDPPLAGEPCTYPDSDVVDRTSLATIFDSATNQLCHAMPFLKPNHSCTARTAALLTTDCFQRVVSTMVQMWTSCFLRTSLVAAIAQAITPSSVCGSSQIAKDSPIRCLKSSMSWTTCLLC